VYLYIAVDYICLEGEEHFYRSHLSLFLGTLLFEKRFFFKCFICYCYWDILCCNSVDPSNITFVIVLRTSSDWTVLILQRYIFFKFFSKPSTPWQTRRVLQLQAGKKNNEL